MNERISSLRALPLEATGDNRYGRPPVELRDFLRFLQIHRKVILVTTAVTVLLTGAVVLQMTPQYTATAVVMLDQQKVGVDMTEAATGGSKPDPAVVEDQIQILTSFELANRVVEKLKLDTDPAFSANSGTLLRYLNPKTWFPPKVQGPARAVNPLRARAVKLLQSRIKASPKGFSSAIGISVNDPDPTRAAWIANAVADAYVDSQLSSKYEVTQKAQQWLTRRIAELSKQAQEADAAVQQYKAENNITTTVAGGSVLDQQIADINAQLLNAKADLAAKRATYFHLIELARSGQAGNAAQVLSSPLIASLRTKETELTGEIANLSSKYGPRHPRMLDLEAQKAMLETKISEEIQRVVDSAKNDVAVAASHVGSLEGSLRQVEMRDAGQNKAEVRLTALVSAATSARTMYESFLSRLNQVEGRERIETPDARVISKAFAPTSPSAPNKGQAIGISVGVGVFLGLLLALLVDRMNSGFRTAVEIEDLLGVPVLATIPERRSKARGNPADLVMRKPMSAFSEALRALLVGLRIADGERQPRVIVVTSALPAEGKSITAVGLARTASRSGLKAVIVDADLRHAQVGKLIDQKGAKLGLLEAIRSPESVDLCMVKDSLSDVRGLVCPPISDNPVDVLSSRAMREVIASLRNKFDLVIIDSPPILPVSDTKVVARLADAVLLVVRWQDTQRDAVVGAVRAMRDVMTPVIGVALTRADDERFRYYSYGYRSYSAYDRYYRN